MFAVAAAGSDSNAMTGVGIAIPLICLALLLALLWIGVRLAPAAATSIARKRFAFFDAWKVSKGRFWALLGAFLLLYIMMMVAFFILYAVGAGAVVVGLMSQMGAMNETATPEQVLALFAQPQVLIPLALLWLAMLAGYFVWKVAVFGVNARAASLALEEGRITAEA
jgi:hypothetical protein